jgi:hypothetical protein
MAAQPAMALRAGRRQQSQPHSRLRQPRSRGLSQDGPWPSQPAHGMARIES